LIEDGAGVIANLFIRDAGNIGGESANQALSDVWVEVGLEFAPVGILAPDDEPLPDAFLEVDPQPFGNRLEVLERFLGHSAFGMAGFVAIEAVAGGVAREHVDNSSAFAQVIEAKIEEARALAVDHGNRERGLGSQQRCQRFQLKARLEINLGASETRRQFVLFPEILSGAGENCPSPGAAAQVRGQIEDAIEVGVKGSVLAAGGSAFQGLLDDIFGDDCLAAMGTILGRIGLKVKTQGARPFGFVRLKSRQLTDFVPGHHRDSP
jgi:hypothetical protein